MNPPRMPIDPSILPGLKEELAATPRKLFINGTFVSAQSGETFDVHHLESARRSFQGPVDLAREGQTYDVG